MRDLGFRRLLVGEPLLIPAVGRGSIHPVPRIGKHSSRTRLVHTGKGGQRLVTRQLSRHKETAHSLVHNARNTDLPLAYRLVAHRRHNMVFHNNDPHVNQASIRIKDLKSRIAKSVARRELRLQSPRYHTIICRPCLTNEEPRTASTTTLFISPEQSGNPRPLSRE